MKREIKLDIIEMIRALLGIFLLSILVYTRKIG